MTSFPQRVWKTLAATTDVARALLHRGGPAPSRRAQPDPKKVLLLGYAGLGDMVFLLPALDAIRKRFPLADILMVTGTYSAARELVPAGPAATALVNRVRIVDWTTCSAADRRNICAALRREKFDACIVPYTSAVRFFMPALIDIPRRAGEVRRLPAGPLSLRDRFHYLIWQEELFRRVTFNIPIWIDPNDPGQHDMYHHMGLAYALGAAEETIVEPKLPITPEHQAAADARLATQNPGGKPVLGVHLGTSKGMEWKLWPVEKMAKTAKALCETRDMIAMVVGGPSDAGLRDEFARALGRPIVDAVGTGVLEMAALIGRCALFLSNDSGPSKFAMALNRPTVAIWGPVDRTEFGAWKKGPFLELLNEVPCSPCYSAGLTKRGAGVLNHEICGHRNCLNGLAVEPVVEASKRLLNQA